MKSGSKKGVAALSGSEDSALPYLNVGSPQRDSDPSPKLLSPEPTCYPVQWADQGSPQTAVLPDYPEMTLDDQERGVVEALASDSAFFDATRVLKATKTYTEEQGFTHVN